MGDDDNRSDGDETGSAGDENGSVGDENGSVGEENRFVRDAKIKNKPANHPQLMTSTSLGIANLSPKAPEQILLESFFYGAESTHKYNIQFIITDRR